MEGIVSLLEGAPAETLFGIWNQIRRDMGLHDSDRTGFPHISYQVAERYTTPILHQLLHEISGTVETFQATATGIALFPKEEPVVYIPIVRSDAISALHNQIWNTVTRSAEGVSDYYSRMRWMPHITLIQESLPPDQVAQIVRLLAAQQIKLTFEITNVTHLVTGSPPTRFHLQSRRDSLQ